MTPRFPHIVRSPSAPSDDGGGSVSFQGTDSSVSAVTASKYKFESATDSNVVVSVTAGPGSSDPAVIRVGVYYV